MFRPVPPDFINYAKCVSNFSICEDKKLSKERRHSSNLCEDHFSDTTIYPWEKSTISFQRSMPLQTGMRSLISHGHLHHVLTKFVGHLGFSSPLPSRLTAGFCGTLQKDLHRPQHRAKEEEFYYMPPFFSLLYDRRP